MNANTVDNSEYWHYSLYGLKLRANLVIPSLIKTPISKDVDVDISFTEIEDYCPPINVEDIFQSSGIADNGLPFFRVWKQVNHPQQFLGIQYTDGKGYTTFLINKQGSQVLVTRTPSIHRQDMLTYFLGPVIGCILSLRQVTCLHAGVIVVDGKALAVIGAKGAGKSTTTAALAHAGLAVISDDIAPLRLQNGRYFVAPGYMNLRLWPNSIDIFSDVSSDKLTNVLSITEKRFLPLSTDENALRWRFHDQPIQLAAVYALKERNQTNTLAIRSLSQAEGLLKLAANVYPEYSLNQGDRARDFDELGKLVSNIPVREVSRPDDLEALPALRDAILADFKTLV